MIIYIFEGGTEQLIIKCDEKREITFNFVNITGEHFVNLEKALKWIHKKDRNKYAIDIMKYKKNKATLNDKEFEDYLIQEFTHGMWAGFRLKHKLIK